MINIKNCFLFLLVLIFTTSKGYSIPKKRAVSQNRAGVQCQYSIKLQFFGNSEKLMITIQKNHSAAFIYNGHVIGLELRVIAA